MLLDRKENSERCLDIVIVSMAGEGWCDSNSDAKGDLFRPIHHLEPSRGGRCCGPWPGSNLISCRLSRATSAALQSRSLKDGAGARSRDAAQNAAVHRTKPHSDLPVSSTICSCKILLNAASLVGLAFV